MPHVEEQLLEKPSGNVRGVVSLKMPISKRKGEGFETLTQRMALATLYTDKPPSVFLTIPTGVSLKDLPALSAELVVFHATVEKLSESV